jgi:hypothetical protein
MGPNSRFDRDQIVDVDLVGLVDQHEIGAKQLLFEQLLERAFVMTECGIGRTLLCQSGEIGREPAGTDRRRIDDHENPIQCDLRLYFGPGEGLHQWLW